MNMLKLNIIIIHLTFLGDHKITIQTNKCTNNYYFYSPKVDYKNQLFEVVDYCVDRYFPNLN